MTSQPFPVSDLTEAQKRELKNLGYAEVSSGHWQKGRHVVEVPTTPLVQVPHSPYRSKLEAEYAGRLEALRLAYPHDVVSWQFEALTLKLADGVRFTPDFLVYAVLSRWWPPEGPQVSHCIELHECKGFMREDARVKLRLAAKLYPMFRFKLAQKIKGQWSVTEVPKA